VFISSLIAAAVALAGVGSATAEPTPAATAARLPLAQAVGQHVIASLPGTTLPASLAARIRAGEVAGVILFSRNVSSRAQLRALTAKMQAARRAGPAALRGLPLLVMIDQEGGLVKRLPGAPADSPATLGRIGSAARARKEGLATARNLLGVGVNVDLAPVVDVGRKGSSDATLGRSFGSTAAKVEQFGGAFAQGLADGGVLASAKHFPGLGDARTDEDLKLNTIPLPLDTLRSVDEAPFRFVAKQGIPLTMVSTGVYPVLSKTAAMFSPKIDTGELRGTVGFKGVAITDDLEVPAVAGRGAARNALDATRAGNDLLLFAQSEAAAQQGTAALARAVQAGTLTRTSIDASTARVLALRARAR